MSRSLQSGTVNVLASFLTFVTLLFAMPAFAQSESGECVGRLHRDKSGLMIEEKEEAICLIAEVDQKKVLATCALEHNCRVRGQVSICKDEGECAEISNIVSVNKK